MSETHHVKNSANKANDRIKFLTLTKNFKGLK